MRGSGAPGASRRATSATRSPNHAITPPTPIATPQSRADNVSSRGRRDGSRAVSAAETVSAVSNTKTDPADRGVAREKSPSSHHEIGRKPSGFPLTTTAATTAKPAIATMAAPSSQFETQGTRDSA